MYFENEFDSVCERTFLINYDLTDDLGEFFSEVYKRSSAYRFVSATERRCFNLVSHFLPSLSNLISNNGLLLQTKNLISDYIKDGKFPRILIVDDIMIHGRGISKFLNQLESLLFNALIAYFDEEVKASYDSSWGRQKFRHDFKQAIDIYIYAQNCDKVLLEDRFVQNVTCLKSLYSGDLRDLSLQLSDILEIRGIANTSYVCSIKSRKIADHLSSNISCKMDNGWTRIPWIYNNDYLVLFACLHGNSYVSRISTIRLFPNRLSNGSQFTSFTMIGDLNYRSLNKICNSLYNVLPSSFPSLKKLLLTTADEHSILLQSKTQFITFIISLIDFFDFCKSASASQCLNHLSTKETDIDKISKNFNNDANNLDNKLLRELKKLFTNLKNTKLSEQIKEAIYPIIDKEANPIINIPPLDCSHSMPIKVDSEYCSNYNLSVEEIYYYVGVNAEKNAYGFYSKPYLFDPEKYQAYYFNNDSKETMYGVDGVISLSDFWKILKGKDKHNFEENAYKYLAAFIALMDHGAMGVRCLFKMSENSQSEIITLSKAGEMATFFVPRMLSIFIPAFSKVENRYLNLAQTREEAVLKFYNYLFNFEDEIYEELRIRLGQKQIELNDQEMLELKNRIKSIMPSIDQMKKYIKNIYDCKQSFTGWNFVNLTYQSEVQLRYYQSLIQLKVSNFMRNGI